MSQEENGRGSNAHVEVSIDGAEVSVRGSEKFVREEIESIADLAADLAEASDAKQDSHDGNQAGSDEHRQLGSHTTKKSDSSKNELPEGEEQKESVVRGELTEVAQSLNVDPGALGEHFYVDDEGTHVDDPLEIDPKYALLGYGLIEKERTSEPYLDNQETKKTLIEQEMLDIGDWGGSFVYGLRDDGLIQNDPRSEKKRNVPFRITPKGRKEFVEWLSDDD